MPIIVLLIRARTAMTVDDGNGNNDDSNATNNNNSTYHYSQQPSSGLTIIVTVKHGTVAVKVLFMIGTKKLIAATTETARTSTESIVTCIVSTHSSSKTRYKYHSPEIEASFLPSYLNLAKP